MSKLLFSLQAEKFGVFGIYKRVGLAIQLFLLFQIDPAAPAPLFQNGCGNGEHLFFDRFQKLHISRTGRVVKHFPVKVIACAHSL